MSDEPGLRPLIDWVWCLTCEHTHIPDIPVTTFCCSDCGFGAWGLLTAEAHAYLYPEHIVYPLTHTVIEDPGDRPGPLTMDGDTHEHPAGWGLLVAKENGVVVAGWDTAGRFHSWENPETIIRACLDVLEALNA